MSARLAIAEIAARCEASTCPLIWAEAWCLEHDRLRLLRDARRIRVDVDRMPLGPLGSEFGRRLWASVQRREQEIEIAGRRLERLRASARSVVEDAELYARECDGRWVVVPGGSERDG